MCALRSDKDGAIVPVLDEKDLSRFDFQSLVGDDYELDSDAPFDPDDPAVVIPIRRKRSKTGPPTAAPPCNEAEV